MVNQALSKVQGEPIETVIAVDPAVTSNENSDLTGIVACSRDDLGDGIVHDDWSIKATPEDWAQRAVNMYYLYEANCIVAEVNQGGDLVESVIKNIDRSIKVVKVRASKGKFARAEPVAQLYGNQNKISHEMDMRDLQSELTQYVPYLSKKSPDRLDALVWGLTYLLVDRQKKKRVLVGVV